MTIRELATEIAKREGKKSQVSVGNVREILGHISDLVVSDPSSLNAIMANGYRRAKRKKKRS